MNTNTWMEADAAPRNQTGLAYYLTRHGKFRTVRAVCVLPKSVMYDGDDDYFAIDGTVTHWMPLPEFPTFLE